MDNKQDKRNAKGGGTVRQRPDGRWEARCTVNGKRRSLYADTQKEAMKLMRAVQKDMDDGTYFEPSKVTVGQWLDIWLEEYSKPKIKPNSYTARESRIRLHIKPALGHIRLQSLNSTQIQRFYNDLIEKENRKAGFVFQVNATLHTALDQALKLRYIGLNPADACTLPRREKREFKPFSETELANFLKAIEGHRYQALFTVTLFTGMRIGEILGLPWDSVDFKNGTLTIKQQLYPQRPKGSLERIESTKNGKPRTIMPAPFVMELLKAVRQEQMKNHIKMGLAWKNKFNLVFTNADGHNYNRCSVEKSFKEIVTKLGRSDLHFHDLRHTYAVMALQEGDNPKTVQETLGHATAAFTMDVYAHVSDKMRTESAARMQSYFSRLKA